MYIYIYIYIYSIKDGCHALPALAPLAVRCINE